MLGFKAKIAIVGVIGAVFVGILGTAYWHYERTVADNRQLRSDKAALQTAVSAQANTIVEQRAAIGAWAEHSRDMARRIDALQETGQRAQEETRRLNETLRTHDLGNLASRRPGLVERRVNDASDRARCLLERASGAVGPECD